MHIYHKAWKWNLQKRDRGMNNIIRKKNLHYARFSCPDHLWILQGKSRVGFLIQRLPPSTHTHIKGSRCIIFF